MTNRTLEDFSRRNLDFKTTKVVEVLPEHYSGDYPQLVKFLESYMNYMDSEGSINDGLRNLHDARDINSVSLQFLQFLLEETADGVTADQFSDPRFMALIFPEFFRYKGSLISAKMFFRAFYGEEVEVSYPKDNVFIVNESKIGPESLKYIQNGALYQTLSILIKSSQPISKWKDLYTKYVHPAGFYLGGEVLAEGIVNLSLVTMPDGGIDSNAAEINIGGTEGDVATITFDMTNDPLTLIIQSADSDTVYRTSASKSISTYQGDSGTAANVQYTSISEFTSANSFHMSDSETSGSVLLSNTFERMSSSTFDSNQS